MNDKDKTVTTFNKTPKTNLIHVELAKEINGEKVTCFVDTHYQLDQFLKTGWVRAEEFDKSKIKQTKKSVNKESDKK